MINVICVALFCLGVWLIIDGAGSIIKYESQSPVEHLIRVVRCGVGAVLIVMCFIG
jgi:hypothetical protein